MIKAAIERILELAKTEIIIGPGSDNRRFSTKPLIPILEPVPANLSGSTLTALTGFVDSDPCCLNSESFFHIESFRSVSIVSPVFGANKQREKYITVTHEVKEFPYGRYMPTEEFIVGIQTFFIQDESTALILQRSGNVVHNATLKVMDDGITQAVEAKTGIARVENVTIPNPVTLRPYRTFLDVAQQPECLFVFRMKQTDKGPECALFEADSGLWKLEAIKQIKAWLSENAPGIKIVG